MICDVLKHFDLCSCYHKYRIQNFVFLHELLRYDVPIYSYRESCNYNLGIPDPCPHGLRCDGDLSDVYLQSMHYKENIYMGLALCAPYLYELSGHVLLGMSLHIGNSRKVKAVHIG